MEPTVDNIKSKEDHNTVNDFYQEIPFGGLINKEIIILIRLRTR